jgi:hypothetical protein
VGGAEESSRVISRVEESQRGEGGMSQRLSYIFEGESKAHGFDSSLEGSNSRL